MKKQELITQYVGFRIRILRKEKGLTQADLSAALDVGRTSIVNIERGRQGIDLPKLYAIAYALGVDVGELLPEASPADYPNMLRTDVRIKGMGGEILRPYRGPSSQNGRRPSLFERLKKLVKNL